MWTIFKDFIEFVTTRFLLFMFWVFGPKARGILAQGSGVVKTNHWTAREVPFPVFIL